MRGLTTYSGTTYIFCVIWVLVNIDDDVTTSCG